MRDEKIIEKLSKLIEDGKKLASELYGESGIINTYSPYSAQSKNVTLYPRAIKWMQDSTNLLNLRFGHDSVYYKDFITEINIQKNVRGGRFYQENVANATAILEHVMDAMSSGLTEDLFYKREIIVLSDLLDQAFEFLEAGHKIAATIYGRIILETTVKEFAKKEGIEEKNFDQVIIKLRQKGTIQKPFEDSLRAYYHLGSMAAHGDKNFQDYSINEIREHLTFVRDKVLTL